MKKKKEIVVIHFCIAYYTRKGIVIIEWCPLWDPLKQGNIGPKTDTEIRHLSFSLMNTFPLFCKVVIYEAKNLWWNFLYMDLKFLKVTHTNPTTLHTNNLYSNNTTLYFIPLPLTLTFLPFQFFMWKPYSLILLNTIKDTKVALIFFEDWPSSYIFIQHIGEIVWF